MKRLPLSPAIPLRSLLSLLLLCMLSFSLALGQTPVEEEDDEDEDETEEMSSNSVPEEEGPGNFDEVLIRLDGKEFPITDELEVHRDDTLNIEVRHLQPNSFVSVQIEKAGIKLDKKGFYSNEHGHLDLQVMTGGKKVSGSAVLVYTPSNGKKRTRQVKLRVI